MHSCESCQAQLLEYLYDLLESADRQALESHLAGCATCQAALTKARSQQSLLAAAAKMDPVIAPSTFMSIIISFSCSFIRGEP